MAQGGDAVDRVLSRIMSSGSKGRGVGAKSPTRATGHAPQRDVSSGHDKRPSSAQKQPSRGVLGTATARDASLAGTTVVPSLVFPKGLLKPGSLQLPLPVGRPATSTNVSLRASQPDARPAASVSSGVTAPAAEHAGAAAAAAPAPAPEARAVETTALLRPASAAFAGPSAAAGAPAPASSPPYAILRQRGTSPPPVQPGRQASSADDGATRSSMSRGAAAGVGVGSGAVGSPHGGSRSGSPGPQHGVGREARAGVPSLILNADASAASSHQSGTGTVNAGQGSPGRGHPRLSSPGRGGGPVAKAGSPRAAQRGSPRGSPRSPRGSTQRWGAGTGQAAGAPSSRSGSAGGASSGHTITRAAALRALKQQRSITPDRSAATATATITTTDGGGTAAGVDAFSMKTTTASAVTTAATPCSKPVASSAGAVVADATAAPAHEASPSGAGPISVPAEAAAGVAAATSAGVGADDQAPEIVQMSAPSPVEANAPRDSSTAAIPGYAALRLGAVRSPSPGARRAGQGTAAGEAVLSLASDTAGVLTERQQRAMRQHVQRQSSPSPHKGARPGPAPAAGSGSSPGAQRLTGTPGAPNKGNADIPASAQIQGWQSDVVVAAKSRIKRLEDQVADLTTQLSGAKAARSEMQRQLEDLQRRNATTGPEALARELQEAREQLKASAVREAELAAALGRAKSANDGLAAQNKALYGTLDETLAAAEHAATELRQLRAAHTELQSAHAALQSDDKELQEELTLRERALSAVQAEYAALKRRHDDATAAAEAARRDGALREGRLRREVETAQAETAAVQQQLAKLQREHQQLHSRKAEKDKQLAASAKRADTAVEQLAAAERLAQEQAGLVRELESRSALLRNRNAVLDKAVATEKEARQAAEEQVRKLEEEIAVLVAVVRQSDPNLESLSGRLQLQGGRSSGASAAALRSAAAASVAAAAAAAAGTSRACANGADDTDAGAVANADAAAREEAELREFEAAEAQAGVSGPLGRGVGPERQGQESQVEPRHSLVTVTALASQALPGPPGLTVRAPPPQPHHQQQRAVSAPGAGATRARSPSPGRSPQAGMGYPAKHGMTGGVFLPGSPTAHLQYSPSSATRARSPAGLLPPAPSLSPQLRASAGRARSAGAGAGGDGAAGRQRQRATSPSWANGAVMVDDEKEGGGLGIVGMRRARTPPGRITAGARSRPQQSGSGSTVVAPRAPSPAWVGTGRGVARRAATPPTGRSSGAARRDTSGSGGGSSKPRDAPSPASTALSQAASAFSAAAAADPGGGAMLMNPAAMGGVFWGNKRRTNSGGGGSAGGAPRAARSDAGGILSDKAEAAASSYAALSARRAMATSWLTTGAGVSGGSSGQRYSGGGAGEPASAWRGSERSVSPAAAPSVRRAKTPEPMTAAAWAKAAGPRRRAATPDAIRLSSTGRGCYKPHPSAASGAAGSNGGATGSAASNELAAILKPTAALFASAHEPALSESPGLQREPTFDERTGPSGGYGSAAARGSGLQGAEKASRDDGADAQQAAGGIRLARAYYEQQSPPSRADTGDAAAGGSSADREMFRASYAFDSSPPGSNPKAPVAAGGSGPRTVSFGGVTHAGGSNGSTQSAAAGGAAAGTNGQSGTQLPTDQAISMGSEPAADEMDAKSLSAALRALQQRQARLLQELTSTPAAKSAPSPTGTPGQANHAQQLPLQPPLPQPHHPSMPVTAAGITIPAAASGGVPGSFSFPAPQPQSPLSESPASLPPSQHSPSPPSSISKSPLLPVPEVPLEIGYHEAGVEVHWRGSQTDAGHLQDHRTAGRPHAATVGGGVAGGGVSKKRPASQQRVAPYLLQEDEDAEQQGGEVLAGASAARSWELTGQALGAGVAQPSRDDLWWPGQNGPRAPAASAGARSEAGAGAGAGAPALRSPARTSRRPSVTEAAEAAVAAGAGVGGPLTALLGQLQAGDGPGAARPSTGPVVETHFSLASALSAVTQAQAQAQPRDAAAQEPYVPAGGASAGGAWGYAAADDEEVEEDDEDWHAAAAAAAKPSHQQAPPHRPSVPHPALPHSLQPKQHQVNQQQHHHLGPSGSQPPSATAAAEGSFFGDDSIADAAGVPYSNATSPRLGVSLYDNHVYSDNSYSYGTAAAAPHGMSNAGAAAAVDSVPPEMHVAAVREMYGLGGSSGGGAASAAAAAAAPGSAGASVSGGGGGGLPMVVGPVRIPTSISHATKQQQHLPRSRMGEPAAAAAAHDEQDASSPPAQWVPLRMRHSSGASSPAIASSEGGGHDMSSGGADGAVPSARGMSARSSDLAAAVAASAATAAAQADFEARMREAAAAGRPGPDIQVTGDNVLGVREDLVQPANAQGGSEGMQHSQVSPAAAGGAAAAADAMNKRQRLGSATGADAAAGNAAAQGAAPSLAASIAAALAGAGAGAGSPPRHLQQHVPHPAMQAAGGPSGAFATTATGAAFASNAGTAVDSASGWGSTLLTSSGGGGPVSSTVAAIAAPASSSSSVPLLGGSASASVVRRSLQQGGTDSSLLGTYATAAGPTAAGANGGARSTSLSGLGGSNMGPLVGDAGFVGAGAAYGRPSSPGVKPLNLADVLRRSPSGGR